MSTEGDAVERGKKGFDDVNKYLNDTPLVSEQSPKKGEK